MTERVSCVWERKDIQCIALKTWGVHKYTVSCQVNVNAPVEFVVLMHWDAC